MPSEPQIKSMSMRSRKLIFGSMLLVFFVTLPVFIFYTTGYRLSFEEEGTTVVTTGGMYITSENLDVEVYLDEEQVQKPRLFRSAYYIQNIEAGLHRVVVQQPGLYTWVKDLSVDPYLVVEAEAFNMPVYPHIRPIAEYINANGQSVFFAKSTTTDLFPNATSTESYVILTKRSSTTLSSNPEYEFVDNLFTSAATSTTTLLDRIETEIERFQFATTTSKGVASATISYIEKNNMRLALRDKDLYAVWLGSPSSVPHYFCVVDTSSSTIAERYGEHVAVQVEHQRISTTTPLVFDNGRACRTEIKLDRKWMNVETFNFLPNSSDLVVMQLDDGLYVTEIDDRSWQNTQLIYSGTGFKTIVTDDAIYILENDRYLELLTKIATN